jgi:hypothetical protein
MKNEVIVINEVIHLSGKGRNAKYSAIANDSEDYASEISKEILRRAVEGWQGKKIVYLNPKLNKWQRASALDKIKALAPTKQKSAPADESTPVDAK